MKRLPRSICLVSAMVYLYGCASSPERLYAKAQENCAEIGNQSVEAGIEWTDTRHESCVKHDYEILLEEQEESAGKWKRLGAALQAAGDGMSGNSNAYNNQDSYDKRQAENEKQEAQRRCQDAIRRERMGATNGKHQVDQACNY